MYTNSLKVKDNTQYWGYYDDEDETLNPVSEVEENTQMQMKNY